MIYSVINFQKLIFFRIIDWAEQSWEKEIEAEERKLIQIEKKILKRKTSLKPRAQHNLFKVISVVIFIECIFLPNYFASPNKLGLTSKTINWLNQGTQNVCWAMSKPTVVAVAETDTNDDAT